jgi:hypothetical protein
MDAHHVSGANAYDWREAWTEEEWDVTDVRFYDLNDDYRIFPGDRFWNTDERYVIEVLSVQTKFYTGTVGPRGKEAGDCVHFERDWHPPVHPEDPPRVRTGKSETDFFTRVEEFADALEEGTLVPHRSNGAPRIP